ncbi:hypothetical protein FRC10_009307 [Ceratobasidium sp. 414]|nr:hypothetical protein FRC10_009307 [Ceratobasidium sp. 414]
MSRPTRVGGEHLASDKISYKLFPLCSTGREESTDGLGEPWEIVVAVGVILDEEMLTRLRLDADYVGREEARKELAGRKDKIEDLLNQRAAKVRKLEDKAEEKSPVGET